MKGNQRLQTRATETANPSARPMTTKGAGFSKDLGKDRKDLETSKL